MTTRAASPSLLRIDSYLDLVRHHRSLRTYRTYRYTLDTLLRQSYRKVYVDQVERQDVLNFMTDCYERGLGSRTVYDKLVVAPVAHHEQCRHRSKHVSNPKMPLWRSESVNGNSASRSCPSVTQNDVVCISLSDNSSLL